MGNDVQEELEKTSDNMGNDVQEELEKLEESLMLCYISIDKLLRLREDGDFPPPLLTDESSEQLYTITDGVSRAAISHVRALSSKLETPG